MRRWMFLVGLLLLSGGVLADISISDFEDVYNLGDRLYIDLAGIRGVDSGSLDIDLVCGNVSVNLVRIPGRAFAGDEEQTYSVPYKVLEQGDLDIFGVGGIVGVCQVVVSLGSEVISSDTFEISNDVSVSANCDKSSYDPGESVSVDISAVKDNGVKLNGFAEGGNASSFRVEIIEGEGAVSFDIPETAEAGVYYLNIRAYDVGSVGVLNEGSGFASYAVNQIASSLVLSMSDVSVVPGNNFSVGLEVFDQSGRSINGNIHVKIISPDGSDIEDVVSSGEFVMVDFEDNSSVGTWKIVADFDDLIQEREFEMMPLQKVDFDFEDSVLIVRNVGNVLYNKSIDINIGGDVRKLDLNIEVGEIRKFALEAPMGTYDIVVGDGDFEVSRSVLLTGNAVSVSDFKDVGIFKNYTIVWVFLIVVLGGIGSVLWIRYRKTRTLGEEGSYFRRLVDRLKGHKEKGKKIGKEIEKKVPRSVKSQMDSSLNFTKKSPAVNGLDSSGYSHEDKSMVDFTRGKGGVAESSLVLKGEKYVSGVVALSIKNFDSMGDVARNGLIDIVEKCKGKGLIDHRGDYIFVVFSPLVTRTYGNERLAVKCALGVLGELKIFNKKFKDKVEFGIGVHVGELVASKKGGVLKYTGIGNTISFAKRMSDLNSGEVVVSAEIRKKMMRDLRAVKGKEVGDKVTYVVSEIMDRSADAEKLKQLLKRQKM